MKIDYVEVGRVGERMAAEPAERENDELAVRDQAMRCREFLRGGIPECDQRPFRDARISLLAQLGALAHQAAQHR